MSKKQKPSEELAKNEPKTDLRDLEPIELPEELEPIIEAIPEEKRGRIVSYIHSIWMTYQGPIPPPGVLSGIDKVIPGGAERILSMTEQQAKHRQKTEASVIRRSFNQSSTGQWMGFICTLAMMGIGVYTLHMGYPAVATTIFSVTVVGIASVFVVGKYLQNKGQEQGEE